MNITDRYLKKPKFDLSDKKCKLTIIDSNFFSRIEAKINHLIIVVNETECQCILDHLKPLYINGKSIYKYQDAALQNYYIGRLHDTIVAVTSPIDMGSVKINGAMTTTIDAIKVIKPRCAIMLGVCASINSKCDLGDVIIANPLVSYDSKKVIEDAVIFRSQYTYPKLLVKYFDYIGKLYNGRYNTHRGAILSGEMLINSPTIRKEMTEYFPEALGYDMEGVGFSSACERLNVPWIHIKGVCDKGFKKTDHFQREAMCNAIEVSKTMFQHVLPAHMLKYDKQKLLDNSVMVSGSLYKLNDHEISHDVFTRRLAKILQNKGYRIVCGMGGVIGRELLQGTYDMLDTVGADTKEIDERILQITFPYSKEVASDPSMVRKQRKAMVDEASIVLFIYGNKCSPQGEKSVSAEGMKIEYELAKANNKFIVPVGATGDVAKEIWDVVEKDFAKNYEIFIDKEYTKLAKELFDLLNQKTDEQPYCLTDDADIELLIDAILGFIDYFPVL